MFGNLTALYLITGKEDYRAAAEALRKGFAGEALQLASLHTGYFSALADHLRPQHVVLIRGAGEEVMRDALTHISLPGTVVEWLAEEASPAEISPAFGKRAADGNATAYICIGPQCSPPVTTPEELLASLRGGRMVSLA
jgi:uncharacterized protein YyaL (SSP411 family)